MLPILARPYAHIVTLKARFMGVFLERVNLCGDRNIGYQNDEIHEQADLYEVCKPISTRAVNQHVSW